MVSYAINQEFESLLRDDNVSANRSLDRPSTNGYANHPLTFWCRVIYGALYMNGVVNKGINLWRIICQMKLRMPDGS
jgi:hypothetical protein